MYFIIKTLVTAVLIVSIAELSKRNTAIGAMLASIPIISVFSFIWLYFESHDLERISKLSHGIFWLVIPSLILFLVLPLLLKHGLNFYLSLTLSILLTAGGYFMMLTILEKLGIKL